MIAPVSKVKPELRSVDSVPFGLAAKKWLGHFNNLIEYKEQHGHTNVTFADLDYPGLGAWVNNQRVKKRKGELPRYCERRLRSLGFSWTGPGSQMAADWDCKFAALVAFHKRHGHFEVPASGDTAELHRWITNLRFRMTNYSLRADRRQRLDQIGFPTESPVSRHEIFWNRSLDRLQAFYQQHGHFKVSRQRGANSGLRYWVVAQRSLKKLGRLRLDRQQRLESIGFVW